MMKYPLSKSEIIFKEVSLLHFCPFFNSYIINIYENFRLLLWIRSKKQPKRSAFGLFQGFELDWI